MKFQEIHIENTNSCGYKCAMCPRESHTRQIGFMSLEDFSLALDRIGPFDGIFHLHGFGEPLLDRQLVPKLQLLKQKSPSSKALIFSTLGVRLAEDTFFKLLDAGLDGIVISFYGFTPEDYKKIHGFNGFELAKQNLQFLSEAKKSFPKFLPILKIPSLTLSSSLPVAAPPERSVFCRWAEQLGFNLGEWAYVHNYSSGRHYNAPNSEKICPVIVGKRKGILNITWDLKVIPCCYDFNATISLGNLRNQSLEAIFSGPQYMDFIIAHQTGDLKNYPICQNCEKNDYE